MLGGGSTEKKEYKEEESHPVNTHSLIQFWGCTFSVSHEATWSIWRFLKTFRREGEFSAEKLNLPYSSGPIWDLSLLTAPQGTACTPEIPSLIRGCLRAPALLAARAGGRPPHPARPSPRTRPRPPGLPSTLIKGGKETAADVIAHRL